MRAKDFRPSLGRQNGSVLIELSCVVLLLTIMTLVTVDLALAISEYKTVVNQVRNGARYATTISRQNQLDERTQQWKAIVKYSQLEAGEGALPVLDAFADDTLAIDHFSYDDWTDPSGASSSAATRASMVTVTVGGFRHKLLFAGFFDSIFPGVFPDGYVYFPEIAVTMRQTN